MIYCKMHNLTVMSFGDVSFSLRSHVLPLILNHFESRDYHVRLTLLDHLNSFARLCDHDDLMNVVLPEVLVGLKDSNDDLVQATLHALGDLVPILGGAIVTGASQKQIFSDAKPRVCGEGMWWVNGRVNQGYVVEGMWWVNGRETRVCGGGYMVGERGYVVDVVRVNQGYVGRVNQGYVVGRWEPIGRVNQGYVCGG